MRCNACACARACASDRPTDALVVLLLPPHRLLQALERLRVDGEVDLADDILRLALLSENDGSVSKRLRASDGQGRFAEGAEGGTVDAIVRGAARVGNLAVVQWAHEQGCTWDEETCWLAAKGGHVDVLQWAREHGCPWDLKACCRIAVESGHVNVLQYVHRSGWSGPLWCNGDTCAIAAKGGHLDVLKHLHESGCPWDERTCAHAAEAGHLHVLKYAREQGCPWVSTTCMFAAKEGHLHVLMYARQHGCPVDWEACRTVARAGFVAAWITAQGSAAASQGMLTGDEIAFLREDRPWEKICFDAGKSLYSLFFLLPRLTATSLNYVSSAHTFTHTHTHTY